MNARHFSDAGAQTAGFETLQPAELIAGPCALPDAGLAMPRQQLQRSYGLFTRARRRLILRFAARPAN